MKSKLDFNKVVVQREFLTFQQAITTLKLIPKVVTNALPGNRGYRPVNKEAVYLNQP
jgi:hypothetical protein